MMGEKKKKVLFTFSDLWTDLTRDKQSGCSWKSYTVILIILHDCDTTV